MRFSALSRRARSILALSPLLPLGALVACSAAPTESTARSESQAIDSNDVLLTTGYTVSLAEIDVLAADEPNVQTTPVTELGTIWTPDRGYMFWADLGAQVTPAVGQPMPSNSLACTLGAGSAGSVLSKCGTSASNNSINAEGKPLSIPFTINSMNDTVTIGVALDDISTADPAMAGPMGGMDLSQSYVAAAGDGTSALGNLLQVSSALGPVGAVVGAIGGLISLGADLSPAPQPNYCTAQCASSCAGGLMAQPKIVTSTYNNPSPVPNSTPAPDTAWFQFTGAQLARIVAQSAGGPDGCVAGQCGEIDILAKVNGMKNIDVKPFPAYPYLDIGCASAIRLRVQIKRDWTSGAAQSAKSGDMAVVRQLGVPGRSLATIDAFAAFGGPGAPGNANADANQIVHYTGAGPWFGSSLENPPQQSVESGTVSNMTTPAVVSRTPANLDTFYAGAQGGLYTLYWAGSPPGTNQFPVQNGQEIVPADRRVRLPNGIYVTIASLVPHNAQVSAVARSIDNLDAFFIGSDSNVYNAFWNASMGTNSTTGQPNWSFSSVTSQSCNSPSCVATGVPGGGVAAISRNPGELDVFYVGNDGGIWTSGWVAGGKWTASELYNPRSNTAGSSATAPPNTVITATARTSENIDVFFVLSDGALYTATWHNGAYWQTQQVRTQNGSTVGTGVPGGPISAVARQPTTLDVVYEAAGGGLEWAWWNSHQTQSAPWVVAPIPLTTTAPPSRTVGSSAVSLVAPTSYSLQAFYMSPSHALGTLTWTDVGDCNELSSLGCSTSPSATPWVGGWQISAP
jgi:hypothetical protein